MGTFLNKMALIPAPEPDFPPTNAWNYIHSRFTEERHPSIGICGHCGAKHVWIVCSKKADNSALRISCKKCALEVEVDTNEDEGSCINEDEKKTCTCNADADVKTFLMELNH